LAGIKTDDGSPGMTTVELTHIGSDANSLDDGEYADIADGHHNEGYSADDLVYENPLDVKPTAVAAQPDKSSRSQGRQDSVDDGDGNETDSSFSDLEYKDEPDWFSRHAIRYQKAAKSFWDKHRQFVKTFILSLLCILYAAYFAYALYYDYGSGEQPIRLLWVTCVVVGCMALSLVSSAVSESRHGKKELTAVTYMRKHQRRINWIVLALLYAFIIIFVIVDITAVTQNYYNLVSSCGIIVYISLLLIFSHSPRRVNWQTVLWGIALQFIFAMIVLRWPAGYEAIKWLGDRVTEFLAYSDAGAEFVFGASYMDHQFAFQVLPVVIFFSCVVSILFYWGAMQFVIDKVAWVLQITMATTAAESINAAGNIFIGQTEAPLMIRPFLSDMTRSEIHAVMTGGFATIAGAVMAAYILLGVPANHLLSASVMSAPAALAVSKLFYPETKKSRTTAEDVKKLAIAKESNALEAAANGASSAVSLAANIAANLIAFIALLEFINTTLTWFGNRVGIEELTFQLICSYVLWPFALVMGVNVDDCRKVAELIGTKTFLNEFVAYQDLSALINNRKAFDDHVAHNGTWYPHGDDIILTTPNVNDTILTNGIMTERSELISTYALCGFSNFSSIGMQIGALSAMAPKRRKDLAALGMRAMIAGSISCFMTACIAGLFFQSS
jgi:pyrimidine nucleoside transport protein